MARIKVDVAPSVLIWARESIGLTREEAAEHLKMDALSLRFLEEGAESPSYALLERMAKAYDRPLIAFFLPEPPQDADHLPDFRLEPQNRGRRWSTQLHEAYRRVRRQRQVAVELSRAAGEPAPELGARLGLSDDPETSGEAVRRWLEAPSVEEVVRATPREVLRAWNGCVERRGILVAQVSGVPTEEMRGFSISERPFPIIALNGRDFLRGRLFTLLHEVAHVLLADDALCDLDERAQPTTDVERLERFCNRVAGAALIPRSILAEEGIVPLHRPAPKTWSPEELALLAGRFGVSEEAMLLRLVTLGAASWEFYFQRRGYYRAIYKRQAQRDREHGGGPGYYYMKVRDLGRRYITAVLDAYNDDEINGADLASYLDIKLNNLPKLLDELGEAR